ncbi:MAG: Ferredoxin--NADP reductase [Pseudomonadota bacterium]|nr:Ferredoxin--NADP reductase [Pseudomonadota bacterium]
MPSVAAFVRGWFNEPPPTFELRQASARWGQVKPRTAPRSLRVAEVIQETPSTRTFVLEPAGDGAPPLAYQAGQHLTVIVEANGERHRRCYSFSSSPLAGGRPAITVKRMPDGLVSRHLHDRVRAGDALVVDEPIGNFTVETDPSSAREIVLVAGGVGITPLISMAETVLRAEPGSRVVLLCGNRSEDEIIFAQRIARLAADFAPRLMVRHALDAAPEGWAGLRGALDGALVLRALEGRAADAYYVCGPEPMMRSVCEALTASGVSSDRIHTERFAYASAATTCIPDHSAEITFAGSGRRITAQAGQTVLQAGLDAGLDLPSSCTMGGCGACKLRKTAGTVVMSEPNCLTDNEREAGFILACCAYADTNVVIAGH